jgi:stage II sporulation protein D
MDRAAFLASIAAAPSLVILRSAGPSSNSSTGTDADPAVSASVPALRVLLGNGDAQPLDAGTFTYDGRKYRGSFARSPDGGVVTTVPVEQYLYSVVAREMSPGWPPAALQAQAICARTYVLQRSAPGRAYDLVSSESDQIYRGLESEAADTTAAVDATAGRVLRFGGAFASIAYSSSCGGHTESSADAWGGVPRPYLEGVVCPWCTASPDYHWTNTIQGDDVARVVAQTLSPIGALQSVRVSQADASGRARQIEITAAAGVRFTASATDFRRIIGSRVVRSLLIRSIVAGPASQFVIEGSGLGHGVGLCQWGANGMASAGKSAQDILAFYFPGTALGNE